MAWGWRHKGQAQLSRSHRASNRLTRPSSHCSVRACASCVTWLIACGAGAGARSAIREGWCRVAGAVFIRVCAFNLDGLQARSPARCGQALDSAGTSQGGKVCWGFSVRHSWCKELGDPGTICTNSPFGYFHPFPLRSNVICESRRTHITKRRTVATPSLLVWSLPALKTREARTGLPLSQQPACSSRAR